VNEPDITHAYIVYRSCGHPVALYVDDGDAYIARDIAKAVRAGRTIERVTIERAREIGVMYCSCVPSAREQLAFERDRKASLRRNRR
jgi:hypothetical protein